MKETVLVIDDHAESINTLSQDILKPLGYTVLTAKDGVQGLQIALQAHPDLIIVDLNAPRLGGIEFLQALRQAGNEAPVILTSFYGSEQAAIQGLRLGMRDYLLKPYQAEQVCAAVDHTLSEQRLKRERDQLAENIATLNRKMERQTKELNILFGIGKSVTQLLDQDRLLTRIVEAAVYVTRAEEGFLLLVDEETGELYMRAARGFGEKYARGFRLKVDDSLAGEVVRTGKPLVIAADSRSSNTVKVKTGYLVKSILHVPILVGNTVIGVLSVDHMVENLSFDDHDLYVLSVIADYAAIALENARLYNRLQQRLGELSKPSVETSPVVTSPSSPPLKTGHLIEMLGQGREHLSALQKQVALLETWLKLLDTETSLPKMSVESSSCPSTLPAELSNILDSMEDGVLIISPEGQIITANQAAEAILGACPVGQSAETVCDDPRWGKTYHIVRRSQQLDPDTPGAEIGGATTALNIAGRVFRATFRPLITHQQSLGSLVAVLRNIDAEQRAQRAKDSFIASVSQELRTPVTSVQAYTELLFNESIGPLTSTQRKLLDRIRVNAEQMTTLIGHLVEMSLTDSGQLSVVPETTDLNDTLREVLNNLQPQIEEKRQTLSIHLAADLPTVHANEDAVYHVLINLLRNALSCSPVGAEISLSARRIQEEREQYVAISIGDRGGGIAPQDQKRVFNRYYRSDHPNIAGLAAPDVGLYLVKMLVEAQGGRVWLESEPGIGSTFTFILPAGPRQVEAMTN